MRHILQSDWVAHLDGEQKKLVEVAISLYERESSVSETEQLPDYSFIIFSMSKAYEGFLKQKFYQLHLIDKHSFEGRRFRIGRALNPDISDNAKDKYWLFDDLSQMCGEAVARELWDTWLVCRNRVFHFFPKNNNLLSLETVGKYLLKISAAMKSLIDCQEQLLSHEAKFKTVYTN